MIANSTTAKLQYCEAYATSTKVPCQSNAHLSRLPAWRRACLAYREIREVGGSDQEAHEAAVEAVQQVLPLPRKEASAEAINAIAYATKYHSEWFWRGAQHVGKWRTTH